MSKAAESLWHERMGRINEKEHTERYMLETKLVLHSCTGKVTVPISILYRNM